MSPQLTQCPHCQTSFRVTVAQLHAARGMVRCGSCLALFSASINFIRVKPPRDLEFESDEQSLSKSETALSDSSDEISLGDLNLDDDEELSSALAEAESILSGSDEFEEEEQYQTYEEYKDIPDLFETVDLEDQDLESNEDDINNDQSEEFDDIESEESELVEEDAQEADLLDEEFHPATDISLEEEEYEFEDELDYRPTAMYEAVQSFDEDELEESSQYEEQTSADELDASIPPTEPDTEAESDLEDELETETDSDIETTLEAESIFAELDDSDDDYSGIFDELDDAQEAEEEQQSTPPGSKLEQAPSWLQQEDKVGTEKARVQAYLSTLDDDEDELLPLEQPHLDQIEEEPVSLSAYIKKRGLIANLALGLISLVLLFALLLQFVDKNIDQLSLRNSFKPYQPFFCTILNCPEAQIESSASTLYSQELLIRTHPRVQNALELSFIFRNDSEATQPFPGLELSFSDIDNKLLANRVFLPAEYLPAELQQLDLMPSRSSLQIMLELADPGASAVNYTIAFRDL